MCVFCKVLLMPNFNFLRQKYGDTLFGIKYKIQETPENVKNTQQPLT